jgi:hypothetical protein
MSGFADSLISSNGAVRFGCNCVPDCPTLKWRHDMEQKKDGYEVHRQLGCLQSVADTTIEYLKGVGVGRHIDRATIIKMLERALKHDGSDTYRIAGNENETRNNNLS